MRKSKGVFESLKALEQYKNEGSGAQRSGEIADQLKTTSQSLAPIRNSLIKKGMIYSPAHGDTDFTVPLFGDFMQRVMS